MAAFNYTFFLISFMIFPMFIPRTVSAIRLHQQLMTPSKSPSEGANSNMLAIDNVPPQRSHENAFRVLMKGLITPSGPSHGVNTAPIFTRHLLRKIDS
ncbi:hypothetical protein REPUB_Repub13aG0226700 [Reevesia pubescens]